MLIIKQIQSLYSQDEKPKETSILLLLHRYSTVNPKDDFYERI